MRFPNVQPNWKNIEFVRHFLPSSVPVPTYSSNGPVPVTQLRKSNRYILQMIFPSLSTFLNKLTNSCIESDQRECFKYSRTSRKRTPPGPRVSVRLWEVSAYGSVRKSCIMHQNKHFKTLRPFVTVLSIKGLLET